MPAARRGGFCLQDQIVSGKGEDHQQEEGDDYTAYHMACLMFLTEGTGLFSEFFLLIHNFRSFYAGGEPCVQSPVPVSG